MQVFIFVFFFAFHSRLVTKVWQILMGGCGYYKIGVARQHSRHKLWLITWIIYLTPKASFLGANFFMTESWFNHPPTRSWLPMGPIFTQNIVPNDRYIEPFYSFHTLLFLCIQCTMRQSLSVICLFISFPLVRYAVTMMTPYSKEVKSVPWSRELNVHFHHVTSNFDSNVTSSISDDVNLEVSSWTSLKTLVSNGLVVWFFCCKLQVWKRGAG